MKKYDVAAYIWPAYTGDEPRTRMFWPEGYGEWQTVKAFQGYIPEEKWPKNFLDHVNDKGEHLDANGAVAAVSGKPGAYTYSGRWDFENDRLEIDPNTEHTSKESVTLYAAWIPEFKYEFYSLKTGELINSYSFDPNYVSEITMPSWMVNKTDSKADTKGLGGIFFLALTLAGAACYVRCLADCAQ